MSDIKLSPHFMLSEFTRSDTATRLGINNTPKGEHLANLGILAQSLESVRKLLGHPLYITSGYRSSDLNRTVDGSSTSSHCFGLAADFHCPGFGSDMEVCQAIAASGLKFDQLIYENARSAWCHYGVGGKMRRQVLSWRSGKGFKNGVVKV